MTSDPFPLSRPPFKENSRLRRFLRRNRSLTLLRMLILMLTPIMILLTMLTLRLILMLLQMLSRMLL